MSDSSGPARSKAPWHLWVVGIFALLWSSMGALDYVMTQTRNAEYLAKFTAEQLEFFSSIPAWAVATWAIAVWGEVLGAILLLVRRGLAMWVFLVSLAAMVITTFQNYVLADGLEVVGDPFSLVFTAVIFLLAVAFFLYARAMRERRVLV